MTSLNRLRWTHSGHQIAAGDDDGHVFIYDVGEVSTTLEGSIEELVTMTSIWRENMLGYLSADICSEKRTVFRERRGTYNVQGQM